MAKPPNHVTPRSERDANHVLFSTFRNSQVPSTWQRPSRIKTRSRFASLRGFFLRVVESTAFDRACWALSIALVSAFFVIYF